MTEKTCAACDCKLDSNPIKVTIAGKTVEVCCEDCAVKLREAQASVAAPGKRLTLGIGAALVCGLILAHSDARAESAFDPAPAQRVYYGDLDLSNPAGLETLYGRINMAARKVCSANPSGARDLRRLHSRCMTQAVSVAINSTDNPELIARYLAGNSRTTLSARR